MDLTLKSRRWSRKIHGELTGSCKVLRRHLAVLDDPLMQKVCKDWWCFHCLVTAGALARHWFSSRTFSSPIRPGYVAVQWLVGHDTSILLTRTALARPICARIGPPPKPVLSSMK